jgi:nucleoside-diphosphate-sugar epimerase
MRVVVVGASGNAGTSLLRALERDSGIDAILAIARRRPELKVAKTEWVEADVATDELTAHFRGADAVVHLAWLIQPSRDQELLWRVNVLGSERVFEAAAEASVPALVYASSVGAYSAGPKERVDETWPTDGIPTSFYARHKAEVERRLDRIEREHPRMRVVRLRPALIFKREAASGIRRLFIGPLLPSPLLRKALLPLLPCVPGLRFQAVHSYDVGEAYRLAAVQDVRGAFNIAAEPVLDLERLARLLDARTFRVSGRVARRLAEVSWRLHLQPSPPGWVDLALGTPLLDTTRAHTQLGWSPEHSSEQAFLDLFEGLRDRAGIETPPLSPTTGGPARVRELATGVGEKT